jgi:adenosylcobinamide-GDP ribazoletransferase
VFPPPLSTLVVLATWKLLTGGIHLDGLADSLDGLAGEDRSRRLAIMKDGRIGVFGALGLIVTVLAGFVALSELPGPLRHRMLLLAPAVGRLTPLLLARALAPAPPGEGLGAAFMRAVTGPALAVAGGTVAVASAAILWPWGPAVAAAGLGLAWVLARWLSGRLGGLTGDGLGAGVELAELGVLVASAALRHLRLA